VADGLQSKVVKDKQLGFFDSIQPFDDGAFGLGEGDLFAEAVEVEVEGSSAVGAGVMTQCASQVRLTAAGCPGNQNVFTTAKPGQIGEQGELLFGEVTSGAWIDIVEDDGVAQFADPQAGDHAATLAFLGFGVDEASEQFVGFGVLVVGKAEDAFVSGGHAVQLEVAQGGEGS